ncbi:DNA-binding CsgD family transcriptional regulator [Catenulispora sp. GP43]|uniref:AAA family ATPase n=1 Tax=Catenulispora sp. GP43 TaxID=3156263 RepID=UPI0035155CB2
MSVPDTAEPWPLVGRDLELACFDAVWAARGRQGVVIHGPAGIGKSRLAEEFLPRAVRAGFEAGRATASAPAAAVPLGAIAHLIPPGVDLADPVRGFAAVARELAGARGERRWVLLVDDLQWLDAASAVLLRQLMDAGVVRLIGTVRSGEPVGEAVGALCGRDAVHRIDLEPFDVRATEQALQAALGGPVVRRTVEDLQEASGGNILFLRELVLGALAAGSLVHDGEIWEQTGPFAAGTRRLTEMIDARLSAAPVRARPALELLALCEPVPVADVLAATDLDTLTALEESGLVRVVISHRRTTVALAHPLYGEALRAGISLLRRTRLLLDQIERTRAAGGRRADDTRRMAAWQLAATGTADPALLVEAAALSRYAHDYAQTKTLLESLREEDQTTATRLALGEALFELGAPVGAEAVLAAADAGARDDQEKLAVAVVRSWNLFWGAGRTKDALAQIADADATMTGPESRRMLRYHQASIRLSDGDPSALALLDDMPEMPDMPDEAGDHGDPTGWLTAAMMKSMGLTMLGRTADASAWAEHSYRTHLDIAGRALYPHPSAQLISLSVALRDAGRFTEARAAGELAHSKLGTSATQLTRTWVAFSRGQIELACGHPATARRWFAETVRRARSQGQIRPLNPGLNGLAVAAALRGDLAAAERAADRARQYPAFGICGEFGALAQAWLRVGRGDLPGARRELIEGAQRSRAVGNVPMAAWLLTDLARLGGAQTALEWLTELAATAQGQLVPAVTELARALAADDPERLLASSRELAAMGADLYAAEAASAAAGAFRRVGSPRRAPVAARLAADLAVLCEGARTPLTAAEAAAPLTARQRDIAVLAAAGVASKDIAAQLHLSVRTVENHLQNAYARLGVTTRGELASALGDQGSGALESLSTAT